MSPERHVAYLHGFASGPLTLKGRSLREAFARHGIELELPDLNVPSFEELTISNALARLDRLDEPVRATGERWSLLGSSFGGYLAARWAERNPERVERLLLLCPGFDLLKRWPSILGPDTVERWRKEGSMVFPLADGSQARIRADFLIDAERHPPFPSLPCETLIVHGRHDEIVPIETSREVVAREPRARLLELDDDHALVASLPTIEHAALAFLGLA